VDFKLVKQRAVAEAMSSFQDFGIEPSRRLMIIHQSKMANFLSELENSYPAHQ
jgi:3-hydroxyisobutyrate dehydrogenase-like beta-hydroxyacid dehydrogenase